MSHSRSQSRPPPKNPLPARSFPGVQLISGWLLPHLSYISYLISHILYLISYILYLIITFMCYSVLQWRSMIDTKKCREGIQETAEP